MGKFHNDEATRPPSPLDDVSKGYSAGSLWLYKGRIWGCRDASAGVAMWVHMHTDMEPWPPQSMRLPENFGSGLGATTPANTDTLYLFPFYIRRAIDAAGIIIDTVGTTDTETTLHLFAHDDVTGKPDNMIRIARLTTIAGGGASTGQRLGTLATALDLYGLCWVGVQVKAGTTQPTVKQMAASNGRYVHGFGTDLAGGTPAKCLKVDVAYNGANIGYCPAGTSPTANACAVPFLRAA